MLIEAAGTGGPELRAELATMLAAAGAPALVAAVTAAPARSPAWQADVRRAAGRAATDASADDQRAIAAAMLPLLHRRRRSSRCRYRLVVGLAPIAAGDPVAALRGLLGALPPRPATTALRRLAAQGLARTRHADARVALIDLAADTDPGTRLAAIRGLATAAAPIDWPTPRPMVTADDDQARE